MAIQVTTTKKNVVHVIARSGPSLLSNATSQSEFPETKKCSDRWHITNFGFLVTQALRENSRDTTIQQ